MSQMFVHYKGSTAQVTKGIKSELDKERFSARVFNLKAILYTYKTI